MEKKLPISAYVVTYNEANQIGPCLKGVLSFCDEVLVADMGSNDGTPELAKQAGAKVITIPRANYPCPIRDEVMKHLKHPWIYWLDADERVPAALGQRIAEIMTGSPEPAIYHVPMKLFIFGKRIRHCGMTHYKGYTLECRFFYRTLLSSEDRIHQATKLGATPQPIWKSEVDLDRLAVEHLWSPNINHFIYKMARYTDSEHDNNRKTGYFPAWYKIFTSPAKDFFHRYFLQKGFLDGARGFEFCTMLSVYQFFRILKSRIPDHVGNATQEFR